MIKDEPVHESEIEATQSPLPLKKTKKVISSKKGKEKVPAPASEAELELDF